MLHERGLLDISDRVCRHIPGYDRYGKGEITIGQVLAHRAGVPNFPREALDLDRARDREFRVRVPVRREAVREAWEVSLL